MTPISADTLRLALDAIKAQIAPLQAKDAGLQAEWSRAAGRVPGVRANHKAAKQIAELRKEVGDNLASLNRARVEIEDALERGSW